jgi:hypothetical protein
MITPIIPPAVSINGTDDVALKDALKAAFDATRAAQTALRACWPHGRDYQLSNTGKINDMLAKLARARHTEEATKLAEVIEYLESMLVSLAVRS